LIEGQELGAGLGEAGAGTLGEAKGADLHTLEGLRHGDEAGIIGDGTNQDGGLTGLLLHVLGELGDGERGLLDTSHAQPVGDDLVELGGGTASQELVQLNQELQVRVITLNLGALVGRGATSGFDINTHLEREINLFRTIDLILLP